MNILIVCGGTGGHLFPGIAVGEELLERKHQVLLVISEKSIDCKVVEGTSGFLVQTLPAVGWKGWRLGAVVRFIHSMIPSMIRTRQIFKSFQPRVVMGMGGFSSVTPLLYAWARGIPSCIHESNMIAGKANRVASHFTSMVAVGFKAARSQFSSRHTEWTGTPLRTSLRTAAATHVRKESAFRGPNGPVILIMGGSQGARGLNRVVTTAASFVSVPGVEWIHLAGVEDEKKVREAYIKSGQKAQVHAFCLDMGKLYARADLVISRSGAASLAEIAEWALPSILIPYPFAAENHQSINGHQFAEANAAVLIEEVLCTPEVLAGEIRDILMNDKRWKDMLEAARGLKHGEAHRRLADIVEKLGTKR